MQRRQAVLQVQIPASQMGPLLSTGVGDLMSFAVWYDPGTFAVQLSMLARGMLHQHGLQNRLQPLSYSMNSADYAVSVQAFL